MIWGILFGMPSYGQNQVSKSIPSKMPLNGKNLYVAYCQSCHGENGAGIPTMNPPLNSSWVKGEKSTLIKLILKGLQEKVKIDGKYYTNIMASQAFLKDEQIAAILTYIRSSFGNKVSAISTKEVKITRNLL